MKAETMSIVHLFQLSETSVVPECNTVGAQLISLRYGGEPIHP